MTSIADGEVDKFFEPMGCCRDVDDFEKLNRIGEGTYGTVYRARDRRTQRIVALKRVILHNEASDGVRAVHASGVPRFVVYLIVSLPLVSDHNATRDQALTAPASPELRAATGRCGWSQALQVLNWRLRYTLAYWLANR
jgi:hypothetical protein